MTIKIDIRRPMEVEQIPALYNRDYNIEMFDFLDNKTDILKTSPEDTFRFYCQSGKRAEYIVDILKRKGFTNVEVGGGFDAE